MAHYIRYPHFIALLIAFLFADLACALFGRIARRVGAVDVPGTEAYKVQKEAVPFVGGFAVLVGFIGALSVSLNWDLLDRADFSTFIQEQHTRVVLATIFGAISMAVVGFFDDFKPVHAVVKLFALALLTILLARLGLVVSLTPWSFVNWLITLFWIVGVVSAFNAIDNTDGVAGVSTASVALWVFLIGWGTSIESAQWGLSFLGVALLGAIAGFLRHNRPPARIYLGNGGAFLVGFLVAVSAIHASWTPDPLKSAIVPVMMLSYPVFDIAYSVLMRWKAGIVRNPIEAIVISGRDHTAHRLTAMGIPPYGVLAIISALNLVSGFSAFMIVRHDLGWSWVGVILVAFVALYISFGWAIRNAVDLRSEHAKISHRKTTGKVVS